MTRSSLGQFVSECAFLHDDIDENLLDERGQYNWDQYSTNAFLVGAPVAVIDTLNGFGDRYIDYLSSLDCYSRKIIIPNHIHPSLVSNLRSDASCLKELKDIVQTSNLHISSFYSDRTKKFDILLAELSTETHAPSLYPSIVSFEKYNSKVYIRRLLKSHNIPQPEGMVCESESDLLYFFRSRRKYHRVIVKRIHWDSRIIELEKDVFTIAKQIAFPLIAETCYDDIISSPVVHLIRWKGSEEHLFTVDQIIEDWKHYGNKSLSRSMSQWQDEIHSLGLRVLSFLTEYEGVIGIDLIIPRNGDVMVVDVNPRFNASTYPCAFLQNLGFDLQGLQFITRVIDVSIIDLSSLFIDPEYVPITKQAPGMFLYHPVWDFQENNVRKFSYLIAGYSAKEVQRQENLLKNIIQRNTIGGK
jgi:ATP-grasp domain-containing protein